MSLCSRHAKSMNAVLSDATKRCSRRALFKREYLRTSENRTEAFYLKIFLYENSSLSKSMFRNIEAFSWKLKENILIIKTPIK